MTELFDAVKKDRKANKAFIKTWLAVRRANTERESGHTKRQELNQGMMKKRTVTTRQQVLNLIKNEALCLSCVLMNMISYYELVVTVQLFSSIVSLTSFKCIAELVDGMSQQVENLKLGSYTKCIHW